MTIEPNSLLLGQYKYLQLMIVSNSFGSYLILNTVSICLSTINQKSSDSSMKFLCAGVFGALFMTLSHTETIGNMIQNCATYGQDGNCEKCWDRYVLKEGQCVAVSDQCKTWDNVSGDCLTCYGGYKVENGACVVGGEETVINSGECPFRTVKIEGECKAVSDLCSTWDQATGKCVTCYGGYKLQDGACVIDNGSGHPQSSGDCPFRTVKIEGECKAVSDLCNTWNEATGECVTCYGGYAVQDGACVIAADSSTPTPSPAEGCPFRTVEISGECVQVSDLCATWDEVTGKCLTCYGGYTLSEGACVL